MSHLSSPTSGFDRGDTCADHGSDGSDQRFLADGEITGNGDSTNMFYTFAFGLNPKICLDFEMDFQGRI